LPLTYDKAIEDAVGIFDIAISYAADAEPFALKLAAFADFHGLRCYHYKQFLARQSGLDIRAVMAFVYSTAPQIVIFDSPLYGVSPATRFERAVIARCPIERRISIVAMGGSGVTFPDHDISSYARYSDQVALAIVGHK